MPAVVPAAIIATKIMITTIATVPNPPFSESLLIYSTLKVKFTDVAPCNDMPRM